MNAGGPAGDRPDYDLIVIGAGPVGENVADYATRRGLRAAIVEEELVGGECSYWACMPSKALLRSGSALRAARAVAGAREAASGELDVAAVLRRRDAFAANWHDDGQVSWLESAGIPLLRGRARLTGPGRIELDGVPYSARAVALATGSVPVLPDIPGLADAAPWGTREMTSVRQVPQSLAIIGGGVAAVEAATVFASFGTRVVVLARGGLLSREEPFAGELVASALRADGVDVRLGTTPHRVDRESGGTVRIALPDGELLEAQEVLAATGRRPATADLGLETVGLDPQERIEVDETMLVAGTDWLYAAGDVNGRALLTHQGKYQARVAGEAIAARLRGGPVRDEPWGRHAATADHAAVPQVVFTHPEVARVGLTEREAVRAGLRIRTVDQEIGAIAGASLHADGYTGRARVVVDEDRGILVGATFAGADVAELLHAATIAVVGEVPLTRLWHAVPAYPTMSELWLRLLEAYGSAD
ncbi:dihydrolipoyl dehydrogenase family protein [Brachybacterium hainanense]|uniref:Dihydrolipoyl dehydrogenase family protein n=1 Tax=Brachybacterium hainanense TaxID=1541174 RepID=A0ABV6REP0_9MICO